MQQKKEQKFDVSLLAAHGEASKRKAVMEAENGLVSKDGVKYRCGTRRNSLVVD